MVFKEITIAEQLIKLIREGYINSKNQFQSTKFRVDHPKEYRKLYYHFPGDKKGTTMQKIIKELGCNGTSSDLIDMSRDESIGIGKLLIYCNLKKCLGQGISISQIAKQLQVSRQYLHKLYRTLEKRFSYEGILK